MSGGDGKVWPLAGNQRPAVDPQETVWLSASAGTGKTQVLSARVLRLLLQPGVTPSQILCLTFTKAGATEMAARINDVLARWVRLKPDALGKDLLAIGADVSPEAQARARTLFAAVLDCPSGGLRIDTIHAFAQWLLAAFPHEAGLHPGVRAMEDRDRALLLRQVLSELLLDAEKRGDHATLDALAALSVKLGPDEVERYLLRCAEAREAWFGPGSWQPPMGANVRRLIGLASDANEADLARLCGDDAFDVEALRLCHSAYRAWSAATGQAGSAAVAAWLAADPAGRLEALPELCKVLFTQQDTVKNLKSLEKLEGDVAFAAENVLQCVVAIRELRALLDLVEWLAPALELGRSFALAWAEAKQREGLIDFDDQIRAAAELLNQSELSEWIRYKLDRRFDHILIDEAQDTNAAQWRIIDALTGDFFAGEGAHGDSLRTLFVVGDYKQAIFRFQGTSPKNFEDARQRVRALMLGAADNAASFRGNTHVRTLQEWGLGQSFRTAQSVLDFVDRAIGQIGHAGFGLGEVPEPHTGEDRPGYVSLWRPVGVLPDEQDDPGEASEANDQGTEGWLSRPDRQLADKIARQVRRWMDQGFPLVKGGARRAGPGDVMVLVRKRKDLAGLIVARLHANGVPVAGVDRLRLGAPLAVRDLNAALRFAAQPLDDLNLASLLVSPLLGWTQEQLLEHGYRPEQVKLWEHLRRTSHPVVAAAMAQLNALLALADYDPPQALLHWLLVGPWQGRRRLVARLGREANDPIDELLNAAHAYASADTPSLHGFLHWFDAGEGELKREAGKREDLVRVMTVHGAKGLQAPIVILADAVDNPNPPGRRIQLDIEDLGQQGREERRLIPLPKLSAEERVGSLATAEAKVRLEEMQEHWRLLYVAMTRAEEALFITGSLGAREKAPAPDSWYARLETLFEPQHWVEDDLWGARSDHGEVPSVVPSEADVPPQLDQTALPEWLTTPLVAEPRPPRPLAPSSLGEDVSTEPPYPSGTGSAAARRGVLIHRLLERLPDVPLAERRVAATNWLERSAAELSPAARDELVVNALSVLDHPEWQELFSPAGLAEVPIGALVGERVIAGTIDRLLVLPTRVLLVDFKTARRPPTSLTEVPVAILRQMAAYAAALEVTYPGRAIEAALLYTQKPLLIAIPPEVLAAHKPALSAPEESFSR
ncbi:MAG TPA: double-strand break repair helicase AddA [Novosphingobium sp.]|nr:double-strand break repair helicase AddA [Novosphingobium sp.]